MTDGPTDQRTKPVLGKGATTENISKRVKKESGIRGHGKSLKDNQDAAGSFNPASFPIASIFVVLFVLQF